MKKLFYSIMAVLGIFGASSCADMLDVESTRYAGERDITEKTDSVFYAYGILQAMQQLADQHFFQNEMRGELVVPTKDATTHLQNLSNFTAGAENKYDSVYQYYKVINNCNYYLEKRDTTLMTGTTNVVINEYIAVASVRAWTYLQLTRQYGNVPYTTKAMTSISHINAATTPADYHHILSDQAAYLQGLANRFSDAETQVPFFQKEVDMGHMNYDRAATKKYTPSKCFLPLKVVLGDLYLELGEYHKAALAYLDYLKYAGRDILTASGTMSAISVNYTAGIDPRDEQRRSSFNPPLDYSSGFAGDNWIRHFNSVPGAEAISYIPMALNYTLGQTTEVPLAFGYDYYATQQNAVASARLAEQGKFTPETNVVQVVPSKAYTDLAYNAPYYYLTTTKDKNTGNLLYSSEPLGDGRANYIVHGTDADTACVFVQKPATGFIELYRNTTVFLHLAEALNRMGEPELAFAILKNGLHTGISRFVDSCYVETGYIPQENYYIPLESYHRLVTGDIPFFSEENAVFFTNASNKSFVGIHSRGAGLVDDLSSPYVYKHIVEEKIENVRSAFNLGLDGIPYSKEEYINAVEDLLCDEYALEFAFEGTRFSDLMRIARHKQLESAYGAGFGDRWISYKLRNKANISTISDTYLPFK